MQISGTGLALMDQIAGGQIGALNVVDEHEIHVHVIGIGIQDHHREGKGFEGLQIRLAHFGSEQDDAFGAAVLQRLQLLLDLTAVDDVPDIQGVPALSAAAGDPFGQFGKERGVADDCPVFFIDHEGNLSAV